MKVDSIRAYDYSNNQKKQVAKQNPNFGVRLIASHSLKDLVIKDSLNYAISENKKLPLLKQKDPTGFANLLLNHFIYNIDRLADCIKDIEPKDLDVKMNVNPEAMEYIKKPALTGKIFAETSKEKPVCLGFKYPFGKPNEYIAIDIDLPLTWDDMYKQKFTVMKLADAYKDIIAKGE